MGRPDFLGLHWRRVGSAAFLLSVASTIWYLFYMTEMVSELPARIDRFKTGFHEGLTKSQTSSNVFDVNKLDRLVVVAYYHDNIAWTEYLDIPIKLIEKDNPFNPDSVGTNNFDEATSYLHYMIKYYDELPDVMAFVHGHGDPLLRHDSVWNVTGYTAIPHPDTLQACNTRHKDEGGFLIWIGNEFTKPETPDWLKNKTGTPDAYEQGFHDLFDFLRLPVDQGGMGMEVPHYVSTLCCSAFTIDRDTVRRVPKEALQRLFDYLENAGNKNMGVTMEYVWTVLFNQKTWGPPVS